MIKIRYNKKETFYCEFTGGIFVEKNKSKVIFNITAAVLFIAIVIFFTAKYAPSITYLVKEPEKFRELILSYNYLSILVFMMFQFLQVIIAAIPGEAVQIAGGYIFGVFFGTVYSTLGILAGSAAAFYMARLIGLPLVKYFVPEEKFIKLTGYINSRKSEVTIFVLFLIPGIPKDILVYAAGLTPIKPSIFFAEILIARMPGIIGSSIIGANIYGKNYMTAVIISAAAIIFFAVGLLYKDKILSRL